MEFLICGSLPITKNGLRDVPYGCVRARSCQVSCLQHMFLAWLTTTAACHASATSGLAPVCRREPSTAATHCAVSLLQQCDAGLAGVLQLPQVDLSQTEITEIVNCAFAHCQHATPEASKQTAKDPGSLPQMRRPDRSQRACTQLEKLRVATLHGRLPTSPGSLAHNRLSHTRPVRYETFPLYFRILRKTSNAAQAALRHSHPFLTLAKRIGLEPKHIP